MKRKTCFRPVFAIRLTLAYGVSFDVQAKRLGGGSFDGKPSYSQTFRREAPVNPYSQPTRSPSQQQAAMQNQATSQASASRWGVSGILSGLALGGLLGSLLFGGGFGHLNPMDFLVAAVILYFLYRLLATMSVRRNPAFADLSGQQSRDRVGGTDGSGNPRGFSSFKHLNTDLFFAKSKDLLGIARLDGFDKQVSLAGAERAYGKLRAFRDKRDLAGIRGLTTDKAFEVIQSRLHSANFNSKTEVLNPKVELVDVDESSSELEAAVLFRAFMREDNEPEQHIREVLRFIRKPNNPRPKWFLDGVQQFQE